MLFSYNADLLPQVRMMGQIRYSEPWLHFSRCINEWVLYVSGTGISTCRRTVCAITWPPETFSCWNRG